MSLRFVDARDDNALPDGLTDWLVQSVLRDLADGSSFRDVIYRHGIQDRRMKQWRAQAKDDARSGRDTPVMRFIAEVEKLDEINDYYGFPFERWERKHPPGTAYEAAARVLGHAPEF